MTVASALEPNRIWRATRLQNDTVCVDILGEPWFFTTEMQPLLAMKNPLNTTIIINKSADQQLIQVNESYHRTLRSTISFVQWGAPYCTTQEPVNALTGDLNKSLFFDTFYILQSNVCMYTSDLRFNQSDRIRWLE